MRRGLILVALTSAFFISVSTLRASEKSSAERGREALFHHSFNPAFWTQSAYDTVWKQWGLAEKPANFEEMFRERYGLHRNPYEDTALPLGFGPAQSLLGKGLQVSCLMCHASTIFGQTVIGLGNSAIDQQGLFEELIAANNGPQLPFKTSFVRGTVDPIMPVAFLMQFRDADLNVHKPISLDAKSGSSSDPPAWWLIKKKKTRDWTGPIDARSDRADMAFLLTPFNSAETIKKQEPVFADIEAFVRTVPAPKYPLPIDGQRAVRGEKLFEKHCAKCHGTYGPEWSYPNKIVELESIGTDPFLAEAASPKIIEHLNKSWIGQQRGPDGELYQLVENRGYQAPPLDGVWATAPYFHNASSPTLFDVLNSQSRPRIFTRSYRTNREDFDEVKVGWKVKVLEKPADPNTPGHERRRIYDTTQPGLSNAGHTFGDKFSDQERMDVIEYLKTL